jgi:hypothetical protein
MCAVRNRDGFNATIVQVLAKRASYICSNPDCRYLTIGPSTSDPEDFSFIGVAAHITAAAPKGPRYDPSLSPEQRSSIDNGIYLCRTCSTLIDKNKGRDFPVQLLRRWKSEHESWVRSNLNKSVHSLVKIRHPILEVCFDGGSTRLEIQKRKAVKKEADDKAELSECIIRLDMQIVNRGDGPASDIHVLMDFVGSFIVYTPEGLHNLWEDYPYDFLSKPGEIFGRIQRKRTMPAMQRIVSGMADNLRFSAFELLVASRRDRPKNVVSRDIRPQIEGTRVLFNIRKLKQNLVQTFEPLYIVFHSWKDVASFNVPFRINAEEVNKDVEGTLDVSITKGRATK